MCVRVCVCVCLCGNVYACVCVFVCVGARVCKHIRMYVCVGGLMVFVRKYMLKFIQYSRTWSRDVSVGVWPIRKLFLSCLYLFPTHHV